MVEDIQKVRNAIKFAKYPPVGKRSLGEFFFYNLQAGKPVMGFTDVFFCLLLANHLGTLFLQMLAVRGRTRPNGLSRRYGLK